MELFPGSSESQAGRGWFLKPATLQLQPTKSDANLLFYPLLFSKKLAAEKQVSLHRVQFRLLFLGLNLGGNISLERKLAGEKKSITYHSLGNRRTGLHFRDGGRGLR